MGSEAQEGIPPEESASHSQEEQVLQVLPAPSEETTEEIQVQAAEKQPAAASTSTSSAAPAPAPAPGERKEDSAAIIESLRARLLSERNSSKSAKQQAHQLTKKVKELEKSLEAEIQHRKRCEEKIQELLLKLKEAGVPESSNSSEGQQKTQEEEQDEEDQQDEDDQNPVSPSKRSKPSWSIPAKRPYSDGSIDVDQSPSESPVSDSSLLPKRVGRSCRTLRRKETWELGVDDRVKSSWSRVGSDVMELSKLREVTGSESGWVGRVMEMFEGRNFEGSSNGEQPDIDNGDQEQQQQQEQQEQQTETSTVSQDSQGNSSSSSSSSSVVGAEVSVANSSKSIEHSVMNMNAVHDHDDDDESGATNSGEFETSSEVNEAGKENAATSIQEVGLLVSEGNRIEEVGDIGTGRSESRLNDQVEQSASSAGASAVRDENAGVLRECNDVESILRALRIAKQQILAAAGSHGSQGEPVLKRSFTSSGILDLQSVYGDRSHGFVVTRPLAQFVHAPHLPQY